MHITIMAVRIPRRELTLKQQKFVDAYCGECNGNALEAARIAGYKGSQDTIASVAGENLKKDIIRAAIQKRNANPYIATKKERQAFWTEIMIDPNIPMGFRLKASELLARTQGDFIERLQIQSEVKTTFETRRVSLRHLLADDQALAAAAILASKAKGNDDSAAGDTTGDTSAERDEQELAESGAPDQV